MSIISIFLDNLDIIGHLEYDPRISKDIQSLLLPCLCFFNFVTINWSDKDQPAWRFPKGFWQAQLMGFFPKGKHTKSYWKWLFIVDLPINSTVMFHSYVSLPEGKNQQKGINQWMIDMGLPETLVAIYSENSCHFYPERNTDDNILEIGSTVFLDIPILGLCEVRTLPYVKHFIISHTSVWD